MISCNNTPQNQRRQKAPAQKVFATPEDAGAAFLEAAKSGDENALLAIFGPDGKTALFSGDAVKDKDNLHDFVAAYNADASLAGNQSRRTNFVYWSR